MVAQSTTLQRRNAAEWFPITTSQRCQQVTLSKAVQRVPTDHMTHERATLSKAVQQVTLSKAVQRAPTDHMTHERATLSKAV